MDAVVAVGVAALPGFLLLWDVPMLSTGHCTQSSEDAYRPRNKQKKNFDKSREGIGQSKGCTGKARGFGKSMSRARKSSCYNQLSLTHHVHAQKIKATSSGKMR